MPWQKQFDVDVALERAMHVFWRQGYDATSVKDLGHAMGIHPGSLYPTYGNKHALFIRALRHYEARFLARFDDYARDHTPRDAILAVFTDIVREALTDPDNPGCLLANTTLALARSDTEVAAIVASGLAKTEHFFRMRIAAGQSAGSISADVDLVHTARALLGLLNGLRILARGRPEPAVLNAMVDHAGSCLR